MRRLSVTLLLLAATASSAAAQGSGGSVGRFVLGPLQWTPTLILREAGTDSNVFNANKDQVAESDVVVAFTPQVDAALTLGLMEVTSQASVAGTYFERFKNQRSVNGSVNARAEFPLQRFVPSVGIQWQRTRERTSNEIDVRAPQTQLGLSAQISTRITPRSALIVSGARQFLEYDRGTTFKEQEIALQVNRRSTEVALAARVDVSPLTMFVLDGRGSRDEFVLRPGRQTDNFRATAGFEFAPDAIVRGGASFGYHKMVSRGDVGSGFAGWTSAINLSYALLGQTRFDGRFTRDTAYSVLEGEDYYVSTAGGLEILHNLVGPLDVSARGSREYMDYAETPGGIPGRLDRVDTVGGGLSVRMTQTGRVGLNYEVTRRHSSAGTANEFERRRLYTTLSYGF